jgi:tetratricopeptide (TPR) repeat protein
VFTNASRFREALLYYKEAVTLSPSFAEAQYNLAVSYLALGDDHSAFEIYGTLKRLNQKLGSQLFTLLDKQYTLRVATSTPRSVNGVASTGSSPFRAPIKELIDRVNNLAERGALHRDIADGLIAGLQIASHQPDTGNGIIKINLLDSFVESVSGLMKAQEISAEEGQPLIDAANGIINRLSD